MEKNAYLQGEKGSVCFLNLISKSRGIFKNLEEVEYATPKWVDWFNNRRLLRPIRFIPPMEYEELYYKQRVEANAA